MNIFKKALASLMIAGALIAGTALPSEAAGSKYAILSSYFSSSSACVSWTTNKAIMIDSWKGYSVFNATCYRVSGKYRGIVEYNYR